MGWKKRLGSISESVNDHLRLRNDYLIAENRTLRHQIDGRVQLTDSEREALAEIGAKLGKPILSRSDLARFEIDNDSVASRMASTMKPREYFDFPWMPDGGGR
jgi:hypothetical protein